jgi:hypothetical protein
MAPKQKPGIETQIVLAIGSAIGSLFRAITGKQSAARGYQLRASDAARIKEYWQAVERYAASAQTYATAVTEADKLLDMAMVTVLVPGTTMGERLQALRGHMEPGLYQEVWEAHKLRNRIAHEVGVVVSEQVLRTTLSVFARALRSFGAFI